ncbi:MAG: hypothetical protein HZB23_00155 [Deltaproteobacteria bacterium]|nr:hypothetical protein [Deltaproteobacteria bacterium]
MKLKGKDLITIGIILFISLFIFSQLYYYYNIVILNTIYNNKYDGMVRCYIKCILSPIGGIVFLASFLTFSIGLLLDEFENMKRKKNKKDEIMVVIEDIKKKKKSKGKMKN